MEWLWETSGEPGNYAQGRTQIGETSAGQKWWASSSSSPYSLASNLRARRSASTETTREWWRAGREVVAETTIPTKSLDESTNFWKRVTQKFAPAMLGAATTPQMAPPEACTPPPSLSSPKFKFRISWLHSSKIYSTSLQAQVIDPTPESSTLLQDVLPQIYREIRSLCESFLKRLGQSRSTSDTASSSSPTSFHSRRLQLIVTKSGKKIPRPYAKGFAPIPSLLWPHVVTGDRIACWLPYSSATCSKNISREDEALISDISIADFADSILQMYGAGLLLYHLICDEKVIPECERAPASMALIEYFVATLASMRNPSFYQTKVFSLSWTSIQIQTL